MSCELALYLGGKPISSDDKNVCGHLCDSTNVIDDNGSQSKHAKKQKPTEILLIKDKERIPC